MLLAALGLGGAWYAWRGFPRAFSILQLELRMDRAGAIAAAESLAVAHGFGPVRDARTAVVFDLDFEAQTFIELEGGGSEVFKRAVREGVFPAYTWRVRRVAPQEVNETSIEFTPAGRPLGFTETVAEDAPGPALPRDSARALAERDAAVGWGVDLTRYALAEADEVRRPNGRLDHTFTYDARTQPFGSGRLRLRLEVAGPRLVQVKPFLQVPEAFERRYDHLRAANEAIAQVSLGVMALLYGIGGVGVGLVVMLRRRMVMWRPAAVAGGVFGVLTLATFLNELPFFWLVYETTAPVRTFVALAVGAALLAAVLTTLQVGLSAMAAESLSRAAFPRHPQFWRLWSQAAGASRAVLARTLLGYLLIGAFLAYMVAFWGVTGERLGWWNPTETLVQPNLFAAYLPWLSPVAVALQAGFWEECLFRAVPLAGAALLGDRFGRRGLWIGAALVVQAVVFSAAHANYPAQPAYARLVELLLPSFLFAGVFLRWGLLPAIVLHAGYDLALLTAPLFAADSPGIWWDRAMVLAVAASPLGLVTWRRIREGRWRVLPDGLRNRGWEPPPVVASDRRATRPVGRPASLGLRWLAPVGAAGLAAWLWASDWSAPEARLTVPRERAVALARAAVEARGAVLDSAWRALVDARGSDGSDSQSGEFVWRVAGEEAFFALVGDAIVGPHWRIRFARFQGDVAERAEEWIVRVAHDGEPPWVNHVLPEGRPGAQLGETAARALADSVVAARAASRGERYAPVAVSSEQRPGRSDWAITYTDSSVALPAGEVRARLEIRGDQPGDVERFVFVPESWERERMGEMLVRGIPSFAFGTGLLVLFIAVLISSVAKAARGHGDRRVALVLLLGVGLLAVVDAINQWPIRTAGFETSRPWGVQAGLAAAGGSVGAVLLVGVFVTILAAALPRPVVRTASAGRAWIAPGLLLAGAGAVLASLGSGPPGLDPGSVDTRWPLVSAVTAVPVGFVGRLAFMVVPFVVGGRLAARRPRLEGIWYLLVGGAIAVAVTLDVSLAGKAAVFVGGALVFSLLARVVVAEGLGVLPNAVLLWHLLAALPDAVTEGARGVLGAGVGLGLTLWLVVLAWFRDPGPGAEPGMPVPQPAGPASEVTATPAG
jgi:hypothetical protein